MGVNFIYKHNQINISHFKVMRQIAQEMANSIETGVRQEYVLFQMAMD